MKKDTLIKIFGIVLAFAICLTTVYFGTNGLTFSSDEASAKDTESAVADNVIDTNYEAETDESDDVTDNSIEEDAENIEEQDNKNYKKGNKPSGDFDPNTMFPNGDDSFDPGTMFPDGDGSFNPGTNPGFSFPGGGNFSGNIMGGNVEIAENPSEIIKNTNENTAESLTADLTNAETIIISDSNNDVKIDTSGTYIITGTCTDGNITVKKGTKGVVLILKDLNLTSTKGACISINKESEVKIFVEGTNKLTDAENPSDEKSTDEETASAFDGAAIKIKAGASVYITGTGSMEIDSSNCKNGIKVNDDPATALTIDGADITITAANDGINSGYDLTILSGNLTITAGDDAIHAERILTIGTEDGNGPVINILKSDEGLEGSVINIFGGDITLTATNDGVNAANSNGTYLNEMSYSLNITGGTLNVTCQNGDGLDSNGNVNLIAGTITIKSMYNGGEAGIDYDGTYYVSDDVVLNNESGVSGPDNFPQGGHGGFNFNDNPWSSNDQ